MQRFGRWASGTYSSSETGQRCAVPVFCRQVSGNGGSGIDLGPGPCFPDSLWYLSHVLGLTLRDLPLLSPLQEEDLETTCWPGLVADGAFVHISISGLLWFVPQRVFLPWGSVPGKVQGDR